MNTDARTGSKPTPPRRGRGWAAAALTAALWLTGTGASAQPAAYRFNLPPGWTHSVSDGVDLLAPAKEAAGTVQYMLIAPKAAAADFAGQFAAERAAMEQEWGLRAPLASPLQQGRAAAGPYAAYFASYDSDGGVRYMGFMAMGDPQRFAMTVFVANDAPAFNRQAAAAVDIFKNLSLAGP